MNHQKHFIKSYFLKTKLLGTAFWKKRSHRHIERWLTSRQHHSTSTRRRTMCTWNRRRLAFHILSIRKLWRRLVGPILFPRCRWTLETLVYSKRRERLCGQGDQENYRASKILPTGVILIDKTPIHNHKFYVSVNYISKNVPWKEIFKSRAVYAIMICHFAHNWGNYLFLTQTPSYIHDVFKFDIKSVI